MGEWEKLLNAARAARNPFVEPIIRLARETGMRRGELLDIERKHVDVERRSLNIPMTKNGHARTIPLTLQAIAILRQHQRDGRLFPITRNAFRLAWERVRQRAGVQDLRFHDLRHEAISRLFELGLTCQSAFKFDPVSASNFDPFERRVLAVALASSELAGVAETWRARAA